MTIHGYGHQKALQALERGDPITIAERETTDPDGGVVRVPVVVFVALLTHDMATAIREGRVPPGTEDLTEWEANDLATRAKVTDARKKLAP